MEKFDLYKLINSKDIVYYKAKKEVSFLSIQIAPNVALSQ